MAKFYGVIGFINTIEKSPGSWEEDVVERYYRGDIIRKSRRWENSEYLNDNLVVNNEISVIADSFMYENTYAMKYVKIFGNLWKISSVDIQRPRINLSLGGIYNGE